ncbi:uncharacterized protein LOC114567362 isoform X2 [Perca flavescens]|nr:uncharacterized protein LOC114567362 isoform X2 [Perca flavescens]
MEDVVGQEVVAQDIQQQQQQLMDLVQQNLAKGDEKTKNKGKASEKTPVFQVGDSVLRQNIRSQQRKGGKLEAHFVGPFIIMAVEHISADLQDENGALLRKINIDQLKHNIRETPRVPHWGDKTKRNAPVGATTAPQLAAAPLAAAPQQTTAPPASARRHRAATPAVATQEPAAAAPQQPAAPLAATSAALQYNQAVAEK